MELRLHLHHWEHREPDWAAAAVAGFAAGAVLMVLELTWAAFAGSDGPWRISRLVAALTLGPQTLQTAPHAFDAGIVAVALLTHYALGIAFGMALGFIIAGFHYDDSVVVMLLIGAAFGALLYLIDFHVLTRALPWFAELRGWSTLLAHLVFGTVTALLYWKLARRGPSKPRAR
jgi:ribose/xylose/arabinose/galactoside ABC-type transport system permease subunit